MSAIIDYRTALIDTIKKTFPQIRDVDSHGGKLSQEDVKNMLKRAPACFVSVLKVEPSKDNMLPDGRMYYDVCTVIYVVTSASRQDRADKEGWDIAESIATLAQWNYFGQKGYTPEQIEIQNLWSHNLEREWLCIMGVAWCHQVALGQNLIEQGLSVRRGVTVNLPQITFRWEGEEEVNPSS